MPRTQRPILALVPRVNVHPTHAVVDGVTYPGGLSTVPADILNPSDAAYCHGRGRDVAPTVDDGETYCPQCGSSDIEG